MAYEILETCMLVPGISDSECSGWVQAWGSIGAILFAWYWGSRQAKAALKHAVDLRRHEHADLVLGCIAIAAHAVEMINDLADEPNVEYFSLSYSAHAFEQCQKAVDTIPIHEMKNYFLVEAFLDIQDALKIASHAAAIRSGPNATNIKVLQRERATSKNIDDAKAKAEKAFDMLIAHKPRSPLDILGSVRRVGRKLSSKRRNGGLSSVWTRIVKWGKE